MDMTKNLNIWLRTGLDALGFNHIKYFLLFEDSLI